MGILRAELSKIRRLAWTYLAVFGMNAFNAAIFVLFLLLVVYARTTAIDSAANFSRDMSQLASALLYFIFVSQTWVFSVLGTFFIGILIGETVAAEFTSGAVGLLFLSPYRRRAVFAAKFASVLLVYCLALVIGLLFQATTVYILSQLDPVFIKLLDINTVLRILAAHLLIDLSWIALMFLVATVSRGIGMTLVYTFIAYFLMRMFDAVIFLGKTFEFIGDWAVKTGAYTFTHSCEVLDYALVQRYMTGQTNNFPLKLDLLGVNFSYTLLFITLAYIAFSKREV